MVYGQNPLLKSKKKQSVTFLVCSRSLSLTDQSYTVPGSPGCQQSSLNFFNPLTVWSCGSDRAPGPDGINFKLLKARWDTVKDDFYHFVKHFEKFGKLEAGCNASFITLVPKVKNPIGLKDFRPISLVGCQYKVLPKLLATQLQVVLPQVNSDKQIGFVNVSDGILIANEALKFVEDKKIKSMFLKLDFEKAFDTVNWDYLISVRLQMGFGDTWCSWITSCLRSATVSVLINGNPTKEFKMERGLRQGILYHLSYF